MADTHLGLIVLVVAVVLINIFGLGMIISRRSGNDRKRIEELEGQLEEAQKELEGYKTQVNEHFMKTSVLFTQMTDSYRAVFMHLAEGSQNLCSSDAALLKTTGGILSLDHEEESTPPEPEEMETPEEETVSSSEPVGQTEDMSEEVVSQDELDEEEQEKEPASLEALTENEGGEEADPVDESTEPADTISVPSGEPETQTERQN